MRPRPIALATTALLLGCGDAPSSPVPAVDHRVVHLGEVVDELGEGVVVLDGASRVEIHLDGASRIVEVDAATATAALTSNEGTLEPEPHAAGHWFRPRPVASETLELEVDPPGRVTIWARGAPVPPVDRARSLVWTDSRLLDDPSFMSLSRLLAAASSDGHGGLLLDRWFRRFATTPHSERAGPAQLMDEIAAEQGGDPRRWDLDALPFKVTGIHNRIDLAARNGGCGELRVSVASTHAIYAPFHLLFIFGQPPREDDLAPDGTVHCLGAGRRWGRLSELDDAGHAEAARAWLDELVRPEHFLLAETVELTVSPWEWRQWLPSGLDELDNPPLFQTVAVPLVNEAGLLRAAFLDFVAQQASGLDAREVTIPAEFRAPSARVPPSAPPELLDLTGLDPAILAAYPDLTARIESVGCPTCHTHDAPFVQTSLDRTFSPFYDRELDARAAWLDDLNAGSTREPPPFGPLQPLD